MSPKKLKIFVGVLFALVGVMFIFTQIRNKNTHNELTKVTSDKITNLIFYKDYMRDNGDVNLPITDSVDIEGFTDGFQTMKSSSQLVRNLTNVVWYKVRFNLDNQLFTVTIYRSEKTGDVGIVSDVKGETFEQSAGVYESVALLKWAENMHAKPGFEEIQGTD